MPLRFEAAILSRIRSPVTSRSNWANDSRTLSVNRPIDVFVLNCSVTATNETHGRRIFQPSWRSQTRIGETINLVHHDDVDQLLADVLKQALQGRAFHRPAGKAPIVVMNLDELPTLALLASDEGFAGFSLRMQRVEVLLQTFLRGFARVSCAAQRLRLTGFHIRAPAETSSRRTMAPTNVCW